jgi:hypothetical protein
LLLKVNFSPLRVKKSRSHDMANVCCYFLPEKLRKRWPDDQTVSERSVLTRTLYLIGLSPQF